MGALMRGSDWASGTLFSFVDLESRVPSKYPLRIIREIVNDVLARPTHSGQFAENDIRSTTRLAGLPRI
jgi:hypothetical protein